MTFLYNLYRNWMKVAFFRSGASFREGRSSQVAGRVVVFEDAMGNCGFVSHQWVSTHHPDPEFKQMQVLQDALRRLLHGKGFVSLDILTEAIVPSAKGIFLKEFQSRPLFLWYDYFSVPQVWHGGSEQAKAITSIPAYVAKSKYFFALCPSIISPCEGKVLNASSWGRRGWCRLERACRELSENSSWILIQSSTSMEVVGAVTSFVTGSVGSGEFSVESDKEKITPVMQAIVKRKLILSLRAGDLPSYRRHLNLQAVHLQGLNVEPIGLVPGSEDEMADFLHQNGLTKLSRRDRAGWWPLHYAALSGKVGLMKALLRHRADPNRRTLRDEPELGFPPWMSALDFAVFYKHNSVARLLIAARARLAGGVGPALAFAANTDNAEAIGLLCEARADVHAKSLFGNPCIMLCGFTGAEAALEEMVRQGAAGPLELSLTLWSAMTQCAGSCRMVQRLIELGADVNFQYDVSDEGYLGRMMFNVKSLQHRFGRQTVLTTSSYHIHGSTPLMTALRAAHHEGVAALLAFGARLYLKNCRGWTAADFARGQSMPQWLQRGLEGDPSECQTISSLCLPHVEISF